MSTGAFRTSPSAWVAAARLLARWLDRHERVDELAETMLAGMGGVERARAQHLVFGVVRHFGRLEAALRRLVAHPPRFSTRAVLYVAGYELIEAAGGSGEDGAVAKIVHHAVEQCKTLASPAEARLVNAVVRKLAPLLAAAPPAKLATAEDLAEYFSHPEWLVRRWLLQFGAEATRRLLEWNQRPAPVHARWRMKTVADGAGAAETLPEFLKPSAWPGFYEVTPGRWAEVEPLLKAGRIYLQDPGTRLAVELLAPQADETVLDLCAAPGGKSL
ncbi:MAG TPA: transcription antitermination factor NusB, partial [Opitutaceae bacterium]|nr:transcription antitermination factor NusB [Opitutaceae bacterium]